MISPVTSWSNARGTGFFPGKLLIILCKTTREFLLPNSTIYDNLKL